MIKRLLILAALSLGAVLAGCSVLPEDSAPEGREIRFTATVGTFQVKATDTAFETGDAVGLFADGYSSAYNTPMTWNGQRFLPEEPLFWGPANNTQSFLAYYPYVELSNSRLLFFVNSDQTTHELFTASDFMTASSENVVAGSDVTLQFTHSFSKLVISINNMLEDEIADVYVSNVMGMGEFDYSRSREFYTFGMFGTIKAGKVALADGSVAWAAIVPPQSGNPAILVTTVSGRQYECTAEGSVDFLPGNRYNVKIDLSPDMVSTDFTSEVTGWTDNKDLMFGIPETWSVIGSWSGWAADLIMAKSPVGLYETYVPLEMGDEFKLRKNQDWTVNYGIGDPGTVVMVGEGEYPLTRNGGNITMCEAGTWLVQFDAAAETVTFRKESYEAWPASVDGDDSDWCDLDPNYVFSATCSNGSQYGAISMMKAFANNDYLYIYFEYDYDSIGWGQDEYVPFHIFIDADNDTNTGWWNMWQEPGIDYFLESFLFYEGYGANYHDAGLYKFTGEDCSGEWAWTEFDMSGISVGAINQRTMSSYEVRMSLASLPVGDSFRIGIDIEQEWTTVGLLPSEANGGLLEVRRYYGD